jgi:hypothetical protein
VLKVRPALWSLLRHPAVLPTNNAAAMILGRLRKLTVMPAEV